MRSLAERYGDAAIDRLDGITVQYDTWWFNVRPSNTEPLLRLVLEAETEDQLARRRDELVAPPGRPRLTVRERMSQRQVNPGSARRARSKVRVVSAPARKAFRPIR